MPNNISSHFIPNDIVSIKEGLPFIEKSFFIFKYFSNYKEGGVFSNYLHKIHWYYIYRFYSILGTDNCFFSSNLFSLEMKRDFILSFFIYSSHKDMDIFYMKNKEYITNELKASIIKILKIFHDKAYISPIFFREQEIYSKEKYEKFLEFLNASKFFSSISFLKNNSLDKNLDYMRYEISLTFWKHIMCVNDNFFKEKIKISASSIEDALALFPSPLREEIKFDLGKIFSFYTQILRIDCKIIKESIQGFHPISQFLLDSFLGT